MSAKKNLGWEVLGPAPRPKWHISKDQRYVRARCLGCDREFVRQAGAIVRGVYGCKDCARPYAQIWLYGSPSFPDRATPGRTAAPGGSRPHVDK